MSNFPVEKITEIVQVHARPGQTAAERLAELGATPEQIERIRGQCIVMGKSLWAAVEVIEDAREQDRRRKEDEQYAEMWATAEQQAKHERRKGGKHRERRFPIPR